MRVIYRCDGVAFEGAVGFEYFCDFVVCPVKVCCTWFLFRVSVLFLNVWSVGTLLGMVSFSWRLVSSLWV